MKLVKQFNVTISNQEGRFTINKIFYLLLDELTQEIWLQDIYKNVYLKFSPDNKVYTPESNDLEMYLLGEFNKLGHDSWYFVVENGTVIKHEECSSLLDFQVEISSLYLQEGSLGYFYPCENMSLRLYSVEYESRFTFLPKMPVRAVIAADSAAEALSIDPLSKKWHRGLLLWKIDPEKTKVTYLGKAHMNTDRGVICYQWKW